MTNDYFESKRFSNRTWNIGDEVGVESNEEEGHIEWDLRIGKNINYEIESAKVRCGQSTSFVKETSQTS